MELDSHIQRGSKSFQSNDFGFLFRNVVNLNEVLLMQNSGYIGAVGSISSKIGACQGFDCGGVIKSGHDRICG